MRRTLSFRALVFFLVLFVVQSGCATTRKGLTPEERASFGTIGVARASYLPETEFDIPAKGRPAGAVKGAVSSETLAKEILGRMRTQEVFRDEILRVGVEKRGRRLVPVDTVLEVALLRIALETDKWGSDPPLKFTMKARCRLVRVSDGTVIDDQEHSTMSVYRKLSGWTADDAARLGEAYRDGYRDLATAIIRRVFPPQAPAQKTE